MALCSASLHPALDASWIAGIHPFDPLGRSTSVSPVLQHAAWKMLIAAKATHTVAVLPPLFREVEMFLQRNAFAALPPSAHLEGSTSITDFTNWLDTIDPTSLPVSVYQLVKVSHYGGIPMARVRTGWPLLTDATWLAGQEITSAVRDVDTQAKRVQEGFGSGHLDRTVRALDALRFSIVATSRNIAHRLELAEKTLSRHASVSDESAQRLNFERIRAGSTESHFTRTDALLLIGIALVAMSGLLFDSMLPSTKKKNR